jgi:hypothetical protein
VYCCDWPSLTDSPQKSPVVTEPWTSSLPTIWAVSEETVVWLSCSLMSKPASLPDGNVNWPMELWVVAVNSDVMGLVDPLLCAE